MEEKIKNVLKSAGFEPYVDDLGFIRFDDCKICNLYDEHYWFCGRYICIVFDDIEAIDKGKIGEIGVKLIFDNYAVAYVLKK